MLVLFFCFSLSSKLPNSIVNFYLGIDCAVHIVAENAKVNAVLVKILLTHIAGYDVAYKALVCAGFNDSLF